MVKVNEKEMDWQEGMTVEDAIRFLDYPEYNYPILVVTLNGVHVKYDAFKTTPINDGDVLKIMQPLAGG
jgi:thiamine biosynthesis protein ThiS